MNRLTKEQLEDIKKRYNEKGRIGVTNHELGDLLFTVTENQYELATLRENLENYRAAYDRDLAKYRQILALIGPTPGPVG